MILEGILQKIRPSGEVTHYYFNTTQIPPGLQFSPEISSSLVVIIYCNIYGIGDIYVIIIVPRRKKTEEEMSFITLDSNSWQVCGQCF